MIFCLTIRTKGFMRVGGVREWPQFVSQDWIRRSKIHHLLLTNWIIFYILIKKTERKKKKENQEKLDPTSCDLIVE